jgi:hypothetical protein
LVRSLDEPSYDPPPRTERLLAAIAAIVFGYGRVEGWSPMRRVVRRLGKLWCGGSTCLRRRSAFCFFRLDFWSCTCRFILEASFRKRRAGRPVAFPARRMRSRARRVPAVAETSPRGARRQTELGTVGVLNYCLRHAASECHEAGRLSARSIWVSSRLVPLKLCSMACGRDLEGIVAKSKAASLAGYETPRR